MVAVRCTACATQEAHRAVQSRRAPASTSRSSIPARKWTPAKRTRALLRRALAPGSERRTASAIELASDVRPRGRLFALDDFGSGFASFYYLKHLDFDYLKIDGDFISKLVETTADQLVVRAVVDSARGLDTQTIAEFVGHDATVDLLKELGVGYGQGSTWGARHHCPSGCR